MLLTNELSSLLFSVSLVLVLFVVCGSVPFRLFSSTAIVPSAVTSREFPNGAILIAHYLRFPHVPLLAVIVLFSGGGSSWGHNRNMEKTLKYLQSLSLEGFSKQQSNPVKSCCYPGEGKGHFILRMFKLRILYSILSFKYIPMQQC